MTLRSTSSSSLQINPLMKALRFRARDLEANRAGKLSERQRQELLPPPMAGVIQAVLLGHVALIGALLVGIGVLTQSWVLVAIAVIVVGMLGAPFAMARGGEGMGAAVVQRDARAGRVLSVCGTAHLKREDGPRITYLLHIEGETFSISGLLHAALRDGQPYCLYYLPESRRILSMEAQP